MIVVAGTQPLGWVNTQTYNFRFWLSVAIKLSSPEYPIDMALEVLFVYSKYSDAWSDPKPTSRSFSFTPSPFHVSPAPKIVPRGVISGGVAVGSGAAVM